MKRPSLHAPRSGAFFVACATALALLFAGGGSARAAVKVEAQAKTDAMQKTVAAPVPTRTLVINKGMADTIDMKGDVSDIMVADPSVVDVTALQSKKLYVVGLNYGSTNVLAVDATGNVIGRLDVHVKIDDTAIQGAVNKLFPNEAVKVTSADKQIILSGHVSSPDVAQKVTSLVAQYAGVVEGKTGTADQMIVNLLTVAGQQQVMLKVKVIEASRDVLKELGIETNYAEGRNPPAPSGFLQTAAASGLATDPLGVAKIVHNSSGTGFGPLQFILRALEKDGLVNTLAEPNLTAISGEQAGFLAGGEFPIPSSRDQNNNVVVTYKPFGVALNFRPTVMSDGRISLQIQTEVSSVSNINSINVNQLVLPGFAVRRAETTVEMGSGGSLMIAGLLQSDVTKTLSQLPGIKDVPILGALMSSDSFERKETELVVIVTPYLVSPSDAPANVKDDAAAQNATPDESGALARVFAANIRRIYAKFTLPPELFAHNSGFGYLIQ
jgi:pilus assembly protein CpaC